MKKIFWVNYVFFVLILFGQCNAKSKNVILMIGDGMGPGIIGATKYYSEFVLNKKLNMELVMNEGKTGYVVNYSASNLVTDSAAAATAIACGVKTYNGAIGVDENGKEVKSILELAQSAKKSVGLITTCDITDATPAGFSAHTPKRANKEEIAKQQLQKKINILFGGGRKNFNLTEAKKLGYILATSRTELLKINPVKSSYLLGLFNERDLNFSNKRTTDEPTLSEMTKKALEILKNDPDGFFLMVEGGRIDHTAHSNKTEDTIFDTLEFDDAIGIVYQFIKKNPDTLLIITADHDTGGIALSRQTDVDNYPTKDDLREFSGFLWTTGHHTGSPVFLFGAGSDSEKLSGMHDNTDIYRIIKSAYGF